MLFVRGGPHSPEVPVVAAIPDLLRGKGSDDEGCTSQVQRTKSRTVPIVTTDGMGTISRAWTVLLAELPTGWR